MAHNHSGACETGIKSGDFEALSSQGNHHSDHNDGQSIAQQQYGIRIEPRCVQRKGEGRVESVTGCGDRPENISGYGTFAFHCVIFELNFKDTSF